MSMGSDSPPWVDNDLPALRNYALTGGRTRPDHDLDMGCLIQTAASADPLTPLAPEKAQVLELCRDQPLGVAEIAGRLRQPLQVTKILLSDLISDGVLINTSPLVPDGSPGVDVMKAVLDGLRTTP